MTDVMETSLEAELFAIEEGFWTGAEDYFRAHVDAHCLLAFPTMPDFHGVHSRDEVAATAKQPNRWSDVEISSRQFVQPASDVAMLSYVVSARSADGKPYKAMIGSGYARRDDGWKLAFHQHSVMG
jgi:hypothetical protein